MPAPLIIDAFSCLILCVFCLLVVVTSLGIAVLCLCVCVRGRRSKCMAVLDESTFQAVNNSNFKVMSDQVLLSTNLMAQNAAANQQAMNLIGQAAAGATIKSLTEVDPLESVSVANVLRGELAPVISQLGAAVAAIQQLSKTAGTTPPVTVNNELPKA